MILVVIVIIVLIFIHIYENPKTYIKDFRNIIIFILLIIFLIFFSLGGCVYKMYQIEKEDKKAHEEFVNNVFSKYRIEYDNKKYTVKVIGSEPGTAFLYIPRLGRVYNIEYKSKYFKKLEEKEYPEARKSNIEKFYEYKNKNIFLEVNYKGIEILELITGMGLRPYILNELLYKTRKGNVFSEIEKIFDEYSSGGRKIEYVDFEAELEWDCSNTPEKGINIVVNPECKKTVNENEQVYNYEVIEEYSKRYNKYFLEFRKLENIDWEEYMKIHEIYPTLLFKAEGLTKAEVEELNEKIKPYYNKELLNIIVEF